MDTNFDPANYEPVKKKSKKKKVITIICIVFGLAALVSFVVNVILPGMSTVKTVPGDSVDNSTNLQKTIMIYFDGADLEMKASNVTEAIQEIMDSGVNTDYHNILIYTGGSNVWQGFNIPTDKDCIYRVKSDGLVLLKEYDAQNMGDVQTLTTFMQYCVENYPSDQYGLIMQNHGGGPNYGVCEDLRNGNDSLHMSELQSAFSAAGFGPDNKMEFIIFDACLMASIEVAKSVSDYAHYMVASENVSYAQGSDYSFMESLNRYNSGADIGKVYVDYFYDTSMKLFNYNPSYVDITFSCLKLSEVAAVEDAVDRFFSNVNNYGDQYSAYISSMFARGVKENTDSNGNPIGLEFSLIDLKDWMNCLTDDFYSVMSENVKEAIDELVVYNRSSTEHMAGVTIYSPKRFTSNYTYNTLDFSEEYSEYVKYWYTQSSDPGVTAAWGGGSSLGVTAGADKVFSVKLTPEQKKNFASARYFVLGKEDGLVEEDLKDNEFFVLFSGNDVNINGNNISASFDMKIPYALTPDSEPFPALGMKRLKSQNGGIDYKLGAVFQSFAAEEDYPDKDKNTDEWDALLWQLENWTSEAVEMTLSKQNDIMTILYAESIDNSGSKSDAYPSRMLIDKSLFNSMGFPVAVYELPYGENGKYSSLSEWKVTTYLPPSFEIDETTLKLKDASEDFDCYGLFVITDIYGNEYCSEMVPLNS